MVGGQVDVLFNHPRPGLGKERDCFSRFRVQAGTEHFMNFYENKGPLWKRTAPCPYLSKEGNCGLPSSDEEGRGWWAFATFACFAAWRETGVLPGRRGTPENLGKRCFLEGTNSVI
jgi:hypothetical protein